MKAYLLIGAFCLPGFLGLAAQTAVTNKDVYVIPFSHLDLFWAGTREECLSRGNRITAKAVQIAKQHPEFRFLLEDDVFVENYVQTRRGTPELNEFKRLVKEGRIGISPKWAGIYQNLPRGEALVRNHIYGKRYAREVFGVDPQVSHLGDLPGYTSQYPQILAKSRLPFMVMRRMRKTSWRPSRPGARPTLQSPGHGPIRPWTGHAVEDLEIAGTRRWTMPSFVGP